MTILFHDCTAGISGDMYLAALLGLGVPLEHLRAELSKLGLDQEFSLEVTRDARHGIAGLRVDVRLTAEEESHSQHGHHQHPPHRTFKDVRAIIEASALPPDVQATSLAIFRRLAEAEATVHARPVDEVHFHEVGATDSLVDIVGAAICIQYLKPDAIWASPVELGGGTVHCAHGRLPVPAPATVELLTGIPTTRGAVPHEATTPTGAAILATLVHRFTATPPLIMERTAYGIGHRQVERPNVLRVHLARPFEYSGSGSGNQPARLLQCNLDDMTAEMLGVTLELLMEEGAMDVHFTPIVMKKNRPATCLSLLCAVEDEPRFKALLFRHTTTLGVKSFPLEKTALDVRFETLHTPLGPVTMKLALQDGRVLRAKPELEDCKALARQHGLPLTEVYTIIGKHRN